MTILIPLRFHTWCTSKCTSNLADLTPFSKSQIWLHSLTSSETNSNPIRLCAQARDRTWQQRTGVPSWQHYARLIPFSSVGMWQYTGGCAPVEGVCLFVRVSACACVCLCVWERVHVGVWLYVCFSLCVWQSAGVRECMCVCEWESACVCVCVSERECVCVCDGWEDLLKECNVPNGLHSNLTCIRLLVRNGLRLACCVANGSGKLKCIES